VTSVVFAVAVKGFSLSCDLFASPSVGEHDPILEDESPSVDYL
jgi:hypothetical protein